MLFIAFGATYMGMAARVLMPELPAGSSAYAAMVVSYFPKGISGLVLVGVFAAIMSTGVVCINCCAANISVDVYKARINPKAPDRRVKLLGMVSSLAVGVVGALLAWWKYDIVDLPVSYTHLDVYKRQEQGRLPRRRRRLRPGSV